MMYYVYILYSKEIDAYYVGYTGDSLDERLRKHKTNHKGFTSRAKGWIYCYTEPYTSKSDAYSREREIKKKKSRIYIKSLIESWR